MKTGYDIGGAEWPVDPEKMTVIDTDDPAKFAENHEMTDVDWIRRDIDDPNWMSNLEARPNIYIGRVLRYAERPIRDLADEVYKLWTYGQIQVFDSQSIVEQFEYELLTHTDVILYAAEMINPAGADGEAEWKIVLKRARFGAL